MRRDQILTFARRLLSDNDAANPIYSTSFLDSLLNPAARQIQNQYMATELNPPTVQVFANLVAGRDLYPLPADLRPPGIMYVASLTSSGDYAPHDLLDWEDLQESEDGRGPLNDTVEAPGDENGLFYAINGGYVRLRGQQNAAVVDGLALWYVNTTSLVVDADVPNFDESLHPCVSFRLASLVKATFDDDAVGLEGRLKKIIDEWVLGYKPHVREVPSIRKVGGLDKMSFPDANRL